MGGWGMGMGMGIAIWVWDMGMGMGGWRVYRQVQAGTGTDRYRWVVYGYGWVGYGYRWVVYGCVGHGWVVYGCVGYGWVVYGWVYGWVWASSLWAGPRADRVAGDAEGPAPAAVDAVRWRRASWCVSAGARAPRARMGRAARKGGDWRRLGAHCKVRRGGCRANATNRQNRGMILSRSMQQGISATYITPFLIQVVCK